jgi:hypothetical protein
MESNKIEITDSTYLNLKETILSNNLFYRVNLNSKDLKLKSAKVAVIEGREVSLERRALQELTQLFGISSTFYNTLNKSFGEDSELLNLLLSAIKGRKTTNLTFVFNLKTNSIVKIYATGAKLISDQQYFDTLEQVLKNNPGSYIRNMVLLPNSDITTTLLNPKIEFNIGNMSDETFTAGMTLDFINNELSSSFFCQRLVCSNGNTIKDKLCTRTVKVNKDVPEFIDALCTSEFQIKSIQEFKNRVDRVYNTTASLKEVLSVETRLAGLFHKEAAHDLLMGMFHAKNLKHAFGPDYMMQPEIHKYLRTNLTMWDLTNQVTAISSFIEQKRLLVKPNVNATLQIIGGGLIFANFDLPSSSIKQIF